MRSGRPWPRDVDDHVDLVGALRDGKGAFGDLDAAVVLAAGEAADDGELEVGAGGDGQRSIEGKTRTE
jgi:hypothetical protein